MLDWDNLISPPADRNPSATGTQCPTCPTENRPLSHPEWDRSNTVTERDSDEFLASVPLVPLNKQGRGKEWEKAGGAAAQPQDLRADTEEYQVGIHPVHPAAVLLVLAWSRLKQIPGDERAGLLLNLEAMPPADQVRYWHKVCMQDGLKPWQVLCLPATLSGADCTLCRRLVTRHEAIGKGRAQYHWACELGYLILEHGRGTERIWISPPECKSFERWYPSDWM